MLKMAMALAMMGATVAPSADAHAQSRRAASAPATSPLAMDVAGVRLGMPFDQARAAVAPTYRCEVERTSATFSERVALEVGKRRGVSRWGSGGSGVYDMFCKGPNQEDLKVFFEHGETGPVVDRFALLVPTVTVGKADLLRQIAAKYGRPPLGTVGDGCWTERGERCSMLTDGPKFVVRDLATTVSIVGERGRRAKDADEAAIMAAADRIEPRKSKATF